MMFSKEDLKIENSSDLLQFLPILIFIALVAPFLLAAYGLGFAMDKIGWLKTQT